jgi:hypothetical protein
MPNHYTTIGLATRRTHEEGDNAGEYVVEDLSPLNGANLCDLALPMPAELASITSGPDRAMRWVHKGTGEIAPRGFLRRPVDKGWEHVLVPDEEVRSIVERHGHWDWYEWSVKNWGTKWGTYDTKVSQLGGDGSPTLIEFQSAWGPPKPEMLGRIEAYLDEHYGLVNIKWMGCNPYDDSTVYLEAK